MRNIDTAHLKRLKNDIFESAIPIVLLRLPNIVIFDTFLVTHCTVYQP